MLAGHEVARALKTHILVDHVLRFAKTLKNALCPHSTLSPVMGRRGEKLVVYIWFAFRLDLYGPLLSVQTLSTRNYDTIIFNVLLEYLVKALIEHAMTI